MADEPQAGSAPPIDLDLRAQSPVEHPTAKSKRFDIFLIDTGWNRPISEMVHSHLPLIYEYQKQDSLYVLTPAQSVEIIKRDPALIGHDPTIIVYDLYASSRPPAGHFRGFRLNLGLMKNPGQALGRLREFIRFIAQNRTADDLERVVRRELHREGTEGMIKLLRETSVDLLVE
jgi:hypothetical protein